MDLGKGIAYAGMWIGMGIAIGLTVAYTGDSECMGAMLLPAAVMWFTWDE